MSNQRDRRATKEWASDLRQSSDLSFGTGRSPPVLSTTRTSGRYGSGRYSTLSQSVVLDTTPKTKDASYAGARKAAAASGLAKTNPLRASMTAESPALSSYLRARSKIPDAPSPALSTSSKQDHVPLPPAAPAATAPPAVPSSNGSNGDEATSSAPRRDSGLPSVASDHEALRQAQAEALATALAAHEKDVEAVRSQKEALVQQVSTLQAALSESQAQVLECQAALKLLQSSQDAKASTSEIFQMMFRQGLVDSTRQIQELEDRLTAQQELHNEEISKMQARIDQAIEKEELTRSAFDMAKKHEQELTAANNKYKQLALEAELKADHLKEDLLKRHKLHEALQAGLDDLTAKLARAHAATQEKTDQLQALQTRFDTTVQELTDARSQRDKYEAQLTAQRTEHLDTLNSLRHHTQQEHITNAARVASLEQQLLAHKARVSALEETAARVPQLEEQAARAAVLEEQAARVPDLEARAARVSALEEVAARVPALEEQAARAAVLEAQAARVPELEMRAARAAALEEQAAMMAVLESDLSAARAQNAKLQGELLCAKRRAAETTGEQYDARVTAEEARDRAAREAADARAALHAAQTEAVAAQAAIETARATAERCERELATEREAKDKLASELMGLQSVRDKAQNEADLLLKQCTLVTNQLKDANAARGKLQQQISELQASLQDKELAVQRLTLRTGEEQQRAQQAWTQQAVLQEQLTVAKREGEEYNTHLTEKMSEVAELTVERERLLSERDTLRAALVRARSSSGWGEEDTLTSPTATGDMQGWEEAETGSSASSAAVPSVSAATLAMLPTRAAAATLLSRRDVQLRALREQVLSLEEDLSNAQAQNRLLEEQVKVNASLRERVSSLEVKEKQAEQIRAQLTQLRAEQAAAAADAIARAVVDDAIAAAVSLVAADRADGAVRSASAPHDGPAASQVVVSPRSARSASQQQGNGGRNGGRRRGGAWRVVGKVLGFALTAGLGAGMASGYQYSSVLLASRERGPRGVEVGALEPAPAAAECAAPAELGTPAA